MLAIREDRLSAPRKSVDGATIDLMGGVKLEPKYHGFRCSISNFAQFTRSPFLVLYSPKLISRDLASNASDRICAADNPALYFGNPGSSRLALKANGNRQCQYALA
jgi:hypothetical protein